MNSLSLVVEGKTDVILQRALLRGRSDISLRFYAAGGRASLATVGRNILVHEGGPLMIVMDADTLDPSQAGTSCSLVEAALRRVSPDDRFDVFAFVPELEVVFFEIPAVLTRRFGSKVVSRSVIDQGCFQPNVTLQNVLDGSGITREGFFKGLTSEDLDDLRQGDQVAKFIAAVEGLDVRVGR